MKQFFLFLLFMQTLSVSAESVEIDGITYNLITKGNSAIVESVSSVYSGDFILPDKVVYEDKEYFVTSIKYIGNSYITSLKIQEGVTSVEDYGIGCANITKVYLPSTINELKYRAFWGCNKLDSVYIPNLESWNEVKFIGDESSPLKLANHLFINGEEVIDLIVPETIQILKYCLSGFKGLKSVTTTNSHTIDGSAFANCTNLKYVNISNSVSSIKYNAFDGCVNLESVSLGSGVTQIGSNSFSRCEKLSEVYCYAKDAPIADENAFKDSYINSIMLYVPAASIDKYKKKSPWKDFKDIVPISGSTEEIPTCDKPSIYYQNGELSFTCATDGVKFVTSITDNDVKNFYEEKIPLSATYNISVYATKSGYYDSEVSKATLCWIEDDPKTEGITNEIANVRANPVLIQNNGNVLCIKGVTIGMTINVFDTSGKLVGSSNATSNSTNIKTSLSRGQIGIVKIGEKSVKILIN